MLLTPAMAIAGLIAALCQFAAHHVMHDRPKYIPRYVVGSAIVCGCFGVAWLIEPSQHPVTALMYLYGASFAGTRIGYATDPKPQPRKRPNADELDNWAATVVAEHSDNGPGHRD